MSRWSSRGPAITNGMVVALTVVLVVSALLVRRDTAVGSDRLSVGDIATEPYIATVVVELTDEVATERARDTARSNTPAVYKTNPEIRLQVRTNLNNFFFAVEDGATDRVNVAPMAQPDMFEVGSNLVLEGNVMADNGSGPDVDVNGDELIVTQLTDVESGTLSLSADGSFSFAPASDFTGQLDFGYQLTDPAGEMDTATVAIRVLEAGVSPTASPDTNGVEPPPTAIPPQRSLEDQVADLMESFPIYSDYVHVFANQHLLDVERRANGEREIFAALRTATLEQATARMDVGIRPDELQEVQNRLISPPHPVLSLPGLDAESLDLVEEAVANVVANTLQANSDEDEAATELAAEERGAAVVPVVKRYFVGEVVVSEGDEVTEIQAAAVEKLNLLAPESATSREAIMVLAALVVLLTVFFFWRLAPNQLSESRHFALLASLLFLAAAATRIPEVLIGQTQDAEYIGFVFPAVMFGYMGAILYDPRTSLVLAIPVATFTAISTNDPALTIYAAGATVVPVAFVSSVSSRRQLRVAVGLAALGLAPYAAAISWLFRGFDSALPAGAFALVGGVVGGLVVQGILSFIENAFRMTTALTLLDLTDRNHPGLRLLEEKAPGTFNHSILVGTLAGRAARAIGADPLLAQAAAYYHDLGKTENPKYYIENQFGVSNPHDDLDPLQSVEIIRAHVVDGVRLARQFRIPDEVADGVRMHHGCGLMRYFYHQALEADPSVDAADYRHHGEKPRRKEMAILMISDSVEGAARALSQVEDPTISSLTNLVDLVVGEKLEDGQLDESDLTFGDLTRVKRSIVDALVGYYHTRIPYPNFPGSGAV